MKYLNTKIIRKTALLVATVMTSLSMTHAISFYMNCDEWRYPFFGGCPDATTIFLFMGISKSTYTVNEPMVLNASVSSDDFPVPASGLHLNVRGTAVGWSSNLFPGEYVAQDLRDGMWASGPMGNAPTSTGTYTATMYGSSPYYAPVNGTINYTVVNPSVDVYFGQ